MALTKATLIDLNANELILDLDADTSITADSDDTIDFRIGGSDEIKMTTTALTPAVADGSALGTAALEWADLFLADAAVISLGADQEVTLTHVHNTGLLLNSTMALQFNDASQYINAPSNAILDINATDEIELNATLVDVNANLDVSGTITIGNAEIAEAELEQIDGITAGTVIASKALVADANIDITGGRNITITGELSAATLDIGGTNITSTAAEINLIDGGTARGTDALASGDGLLVNDAGTMKMTNVDTVSTYFASHSVGGGNIVTVGALNSGSITSGFTSIDVGSGAITTTGDITGGTFAATGDTAASDNASVGYTAAEGLILTGQGSTNDVTVKNDADADVLTIATGTTSVDIVGDVTASTLNADGDTAAGDNAAIGYTAGEGLILTGQGSTSDVVIKNDADATVFSIATGTTTGTFAGTVLAKTDTDTSNTGSITLDFTANQNFVLTLTGNVTLANPSTEQVGQSGFIAFIQDGTGSRTVTLGTDYETAAAAGITLTSTASATDLVPYLVVASNRILLGTPQLAFA